MVDDKEVREIEGKLEVRDAGKIALQIGLLVTIYFKKAHDPHVQEALAACFDQYRALVGDALHWVAHPATGRFHPIQDGRVPSPAEWFRQLARGEEWAFQYRGGEDAGSANPFSVEALGVQDYGKDELSYFKATLPMTFFAQHQSTFSDLVMEFCRRVRPEQGYGGLGILESPYERIRAQYETTVYRIAKQFPGLEVDDPTGHCIWLEQEDGIKGGNWLTILGNRWLQRIGGVQGLRSKLSSDFRITEYPDGALIQAGLRPQMGDVEKGAIPELYARLAHVLKPIRITKHRMFQHPGENRFDKAASEAWLARFDTMPNR